MSSTVSTLEIKIVQKCVQLVKYEYRFWFFLEIQDLSRRSTQGLVHMFTFHDKGQDAQTRPGKGKQNRETSNKYLNLESDLEKEKIL